MFCFREIFSTGCIEKHLCFRAIVSIFCMYVTFRVLLHVSSHRASSTMNRKLFGGRNLILWNNDNHPSCAVDAKHFLKPLGVDVLITVLSDYCEHFQICDRRRKIKVLDKETAFSLNTTVLNEFYEAYKDDAEMKKVDAFLCFDPPAVCELFEPFNRSLIVVFTSRFYLHRNHMRAKIFWKHKLQRIAKDPKNVIAANNIYDAKVVEYYTGIKPVYLPNYCDYTNTTYKATRPGYLLAKRRPDRNHNHWFKSQFDSVASNKTAGRVPELIDVEQRYPVYNFTDLAAHRGIIHLPYQVSIMSLFEQYRMNIPLFFPSQQLLLHWDSEHHIVVDRVVTLFSQKPHPSQRHIPNPVQTFDLKAVAYWLKYADFYTWPHIVYFDSIEHLVELLERLTTDDLLAISERMKQYNMELKNSLVHKWTRILRNVAKYRSFT